MKKYLLSTSALASVALISSLASAEVELGGKVEFNLFSGDNHGGQNLVVDDADLFISGSTTTDGGLDVTGKVNFEGNGDGSISSDDVELIISGGFGSVKLHDGDEYAGAAGQLGIYAASVAAGTGGIDGNSSLTWSNLAPTVDEDDSDNSTAGVGIYPGYAAGPGISYLSNDFSGVTFGATLYFGQTGATDPAPGLNDDEDAVKVVDGDDAFTTTGQEIAIAYNADIGPGSLGVSFTSAEATTETYTTDDGFDGASTEVTDSRSSYGLSYSMAGISFAFGVLDIDAQESDTDRTAGEYGIESSSTHLGLAYNFGAGNVSYTTVSTDYTKIDHEGDSTELKNGASASVISLDYSLGEGITLTADSASVTYIDLDADLEKDDVSELVLGINVNF